MCGLGSLRDNWNFTRAQTLPPGGRGKALVALVTALRLLLSATSVVDPLADVDHDFKRRELVCQALKLQIIDNLVIYERGVSEAELPPVLHTILHVPDAIYRWNGVHNQWCFTNERLPPCCCQLLAITLLPLCCHLSTTI